VKTRTAIVVALLLVVSLAPVAADPGVVRIATTVTDRQGNLIAGLTARDFELREEGAVQKIVSAEPRSRGPRRIALLLDEFHIDAADSAVVRDAVLRFVDDQLRADDALVVLKPLDPLTGIRLTSDREAFRTVVAGFEGRKGNYEPRSVLEEETLGRAPALVEAGRVQVVLSALRALTAQLGSTPGRSAVLLVSEGFNPQAPRPFPRGLPDVGIVERFANRYDVPIYAFDPRRPGEEPEMGAAVLGKLVAETGGTLARGADLAMNLGRAASDLDAGYTLTYNSPDGEDGRYHRVQVTILRRVADARSRAGYVAAPSAEMRRALRAMSTDGPVLPTRMLRRSSLIDVWSGVTRMTGGNGRVAVTWGPGRPAAGAVKSGAARVALKATTKDGTVLYEGMIAPIQFGTVGEAALTDRAEFDAPAGRVQLDMTILGIRGEKIDVDARDVEVPVLNGSAAFVLPPIVIATQSAREFHAIAADDTAAPDPSREFRRTERLVVRVPAYVAGSPAPVTARLLNRLGQTMKDLVALPDAAGGVTQFDLPLAPLAPGDYFLLFSITGPSGAVSQRVGFKVTG
jgi:VWFA-related protein